ncbi:MAG: ABC transporter transmembrane domain-containing protein [Oligoflexales bacterium]
MSRMKKILDDLFFTGVTPLVKRGERIALTEADMPSLPEFLTESAIENLPWGEDLKSDWVFVRGLLQGSLSTWKWGFVFCALSAALTLVSPLLVYQFIRALTGEIELSLAQLIGLGVSIGLTGILAGVFAQHHFLRILWAFQVISNRLNTLIFKQSMRISAKDRDAMTIGEIVNRMGSDTDSLSNLPTVLINVTVSVLQVLGVAGVLTYMLGWSALPLLFIILVMVAPTRAAAKIIVKYDNKMMKRRDERVTLMGQILNGIRIVKYLRWEADLQKEIETKRAAELRDRWAMAKAEMICTVAFASVSAVSLFFILLLHERLGNPLTLPVVFSTFSLLQILEEPFGSVGRHLASFANARVGAARIREFLNLKSEPRFKGSEMKPALVIQDASVVYPDVKALDRINLQVTEGESVAIVGPVGAGKSTLLELVLGEAIPQEGHVRHKSGLKIAYVPQESFVLNTSLARNISFGSDWSSEPTHSGESALQDAVRSAQLAADLSAWRHGFSSEIGEKGINLSGGQKQRISLARAAFAKTDVILFDDPLSAVDHPTAEALIDDLVFGSLQDKTRIMATHRLEGLERFDRVIFLVQGKILAQGSFGSLMDTSADFRQFVENGLVDSNAQSLTDVDSDRTTKTTPADSSSETFSAIEDRERGAVSPKLYWIYLRELATSKPFNYLVLALTAITYPLFSVVQKLVFTDLDAFGSAKDLIYLFGMISLASVFSLVISDLFWLNRGLKAGKRFHENMLRSILNTKMRFFDTNPVGRILQRFSRDTEAIDMQIQWTFENTVKIGANIIVSLAVIVISLPWLLVAMGPIGWYYYILQRRYRSVAREAKRLDSVARSPVYAHLKETLAGLTSIRAYAREGAFYREFVRRVEHSQRMFFGHYMINRWFSTRIPLVGGMITVCTGAALALAVSNGATSAGLAALVMTTCISFWGTLNWAVRVFADLEARMTSLERVNTYSNLEVECSLQRHSEPTIQNGAVSFKNVWVQYANDLPWTLRDVSFEIPHATKVGLVGRTGSGKSTVFQTLFQIIRHSKGTITLGGVDIAQLPLEALRRHIAIIPQEPILFQGTLRSNLDRYREHSDMKIWSVLELVGLAAHFKLAGLDHQLVENGNNLSLGQRQLLCLARALLSAAPLVVLDEATASVDFVTDRKIQRIIKEHFRDRTLMIIAHRLTTVEDCELIIELEHGTVKNVRSIKQLETKVDFRLDIKLHSESNT